MPNQENIDNVVIRDDELHGSRIETIPVPKRKQDVDLDDTLYDNIIQAGMSSQLDINTFFSLNRTAENRNQMYNLFDAMCADGSISAVMETYAEDATERNDSGNIVWVESNESNIAKYVEYLLDTLNVNKHIYKWCYSLCKYGDLYLRLYRQSDYEDSLFSSNKQPQQLNEDVIIKSYGKTDSYAHYMEMVSNPATMFELTRFGKTVGYVEAPVSNTVVKNTNTSFNTFTYSYQFKKDDVTLYPATEFVHASLEGDGSREEEKVDIFLNQEAMDANKTDYSYKVRKGQSLLSNVYKVWRELSLLENSVLLNRLTKSSIVRLINVEVGDMPKENIGKTLMGIKQMVEQKSAINTGSSMNEYTNPGPVENNVYIPTHEGVGSVTTSQIGGDVDVKGLADLDYYMNKMYGELRVPKQYFSQTDDSTGFNGGSSLTIISSRYAKMIKRIQNTLIQAITDAVNLMLIDKGLDSYVNQFTIHMLAPTTQEEIDRRDNLSSKVQLTSDIMNMLEVIEDPAAKLKILQSLLSNIIDDTDILQVLTEEIEKMENESAEFVEDEPVEGDELGSGGGFTGDLAADLGAPGGDDMSAEPDADTSGDEDILPSPDELGVDLNDEGE